MASRGTIERVTAREVLNGIGDPTVEVDVYVAGGGFGRASVPSGASTGRYEALELRDGGARYGGRGVLKAVANVNDVIAPHVVGVSAMDQRALDLSLNDLDGTENKAQLGANAILAVSIAAAKAAAATSDLPLYRYLGATSPLALPMPGANLIAGSTHAGNSLDFEDHLIFPADSMSFRGVTQASVEIYKRLGSILEARFGPVRTVGGAYAPPMASEEDALECIVDAIRETGYEGRFMIGLDVAASLIYGPATGRYRTARGDLSTPELIDYYEDLIARYPIRLIEDPFQEDDFAGFREATARLKVTVVGDDLFTSNSRRLTKGIEMGAANGVLLKVNQVGTITEALETAATARKAGYTVVASVRSGECEDTAFADIAIAAGAEFAKLGAPARGERNNKYNRFLRIEEELETGRRVL